MSHHGEYLNELRKQFGTPETGPTGRYPMGKLNEDDEGEITIAVAADPKTQRIIIDLGKPVAWIGFTAEQAVELADVLTKKAWQARGISG